MSAPTLANAPQSVMDELVALVCEVQAEAWGRGYSAGYAAAQEDADQGVVNRQVSRAGVANIGTEVARAKADGRPPRLYAEGVSR